MLSIGGYNNLTVCKESEHGVYLEAGLDRSILLPNADVPTGCEVGQSLKVFVHFDSEDRLVATTRTPKAKVGEFAYLKVTSLQSVGAFLDWGLRKDLLLPFREQTRDLKCGDGVVVFIYMDKSDRIAASMRLDQYIDETPEFYGKNQPVDLLIIAKTDLGYKAIVNQRHVGVIYQNEVFQPVVIGQSIKGFVKLVRPDGKIDLCLTQTSHFGRDDIGGKIVELLRKNDGYLPFGDKSSAEEISQTFGVSKKKFKMAVGGLYKRHEIVFENNGIRLR